jgi:hypothetical protein
MSIWEIAYISLASFLTLIDGIWSRPIVAVYFDMGIDFLVYEYEDKVIFSIIDLIASK